MEAAFADSGTEGGNPALNAVAFAIFALVYLFCMTVANFCNVAFFSEIIRGLGGENVSVSRGFGYALYRLKAIFFWSLLASTIGIILSVLERRAGLVGRIVLKLIGVVWAVASVFAVPAIVCDPELSNPFTALKRSASIIRRTWGETLIGFAGLHIITGVGVFLFLLALFAVGALIGAAGGGAVPVITGAGVGMLLFLCFFAFCYLVSVAEKVYIASLYLYETLEKIGMADEILKAIRHDYLPMLELGSSTVWETYPNALNLREYPTRSHCHGWSAAPLYFLPRLLLGILPAAPGAKKFRISPRITGLEYAAGARPTVHGRVETAWKKQGDKLFITATAPAGVELEYLYNDTHADFEVIFNGESM